MASFRLRDVAKSWTNQPLVLYHGTLHKYSDSIMKQGIDLSQVRARTDFGRGFYTTTLPDQAAKWARELQGRTDNPQDTDNAPVIIRYEVSREEIAKLDSLWFIDAGEDFWSLVHYCRRGSLGHKRIGTQMYYDVVAGPVTAFWQQGLVILGTDQISFHNDRAIALLQSNPATVLQVMEEE
jgi:hypothetical protein